MIETIENPETKQKLMEARERLNTATRYLCFMLGEAKLNDKYDALPKPIRDWSSIHDVADEIRVRNRIKFLIREGESSPFMLAKTLMDAAVAVHPVSRYHVEWFYQMAQSEIEKLVIERK